MGSFSYNLTLNIKTMGKQIKGEKFIYLLMAYKLAKENGGKVMIGDDNGMVGGQEYYRNFRVIKHEDKEIIIEAKNSRHFAEFTRSFEVKDNGGSYPIIKEYINEYEENCSKRWTH